DDLSLLAELVAPGSAHAATATKLPPVELMRATQDLLLRWITAASADAPLLLVCEDLHWADSSTLALLERLVHATHAPARGTMILLTARSGFAAPWTMPASAAMLVIDRLGPGSTARLVQQLAGARELPAALVQRIVDASDGVPLYAEEVTRAVLAAGASDGAAIEVPATLQASLLARLDRLGPARALAQTAALLGREFSFELLAAVVDLPVARLGQALHQLVAADLLRRRGAPPQARYTFRHALLQSAAADSMLRATRMHSHRRIAEVLQARFPGAVEAEPEIAAHHLAEAGESRRAIALWERAGERALGRSAVTEAVAHFDAALSLLDAVHDREERERLELGLRVPRAGALRALCGVAAPATGEAYEQAVGLARRLGEDQRLIPCLNGLYAYHMVRGQCDAALAPAQELLQVAHRCGDAVGEMIGHRAVGAVAFHVGHPLRAQEHLRRALALYVPARDAQLAVTLGIDHKVSACNFLALTCLVLDDADEAMSLQRDGLARAESLAHAHSVAQALVFGCLLLALRGDWDELRDWSQRTCALAGERGFALMDAGGRFFRACAIAFDGDAEAGLAQMHEGAQAWWKTGARNYRTFAEMLLARAHAQLGQHDAAAALLREAHAGIAATGERWVEPELWRVEALLLRERPDADAGSIEARLQRALSLAQGQQARRWERLAAASLAAARAAATRPPAAS
ncbi:MAG TPA: hypothetical protein VJ743_16435, partial [Albitalea sp.]|nr:hypothetical protein [Albitalea sp.]